MALLEEKYAEAGRHYERALAMVPNDAAAHALYAVTCLLPLRKLHDARREARLAYELDRQNGLSMYAMVLTDFCARDYRAAVAHAEEALIQQPDNMVIPGLRIDSYLATASFDEAWFFVEKSRDTRDAYYALIRARKGHREDALRIGREWAQAGIEPLMTARLFAAGGDRTATLHWLDEADRRHDFFARLSARYAPDFDTIRPLPEFNALLNAMSTPRYP